MVSYKCYIDFCCLYLTVNELCRSKDRLELVLAARWRRWQNLTSPLNTLTTVSFSGQCLFPRFLEPFGNYKLFCSNTQQRSMIYILPHCFSCMLLLQSDIHASKTSPTIPSGIRKCLWWSYFYQIPFRCPKGLRYLFFDPRNSNVQPN